MNGSSQPIEAAVALVFGGFVFLLFASELPSGGFVNYGSWGAIFVLAGLTSLVIIGVAAVASAFN